MPRVSIVVPHLGDTAAFETTLASVLQHRESDSEVIVPHGGDYDDPFDLSDEVRYVDTHGGDLVEQVAQSAQVAHGRFVHVIGNGLTATSGWTDHAIEKFEHHDAGVVVPVTRTKQTKLIANAGWRRGGSLACAVNAGDSAKLSSRDAASAEGAFLTASFWRRDLLRSLSTAFRGNDEFEASLVFGLLASQNKWRCVVAERSQLSVSVDQAFKVQRSISTNQRRLQAIVDQFGSGGWGKSVSRLLSTIVSHRFAPSSISVAVARATAPLATKAVQSCIRHVDVFSPTEDRETLQMPQRNTQQSVSMRRAA